MSGLVKVDASDLAKKHVRLTGGKLDRDPNPPAPPPPPFPGNRWLVLCMRWPCPWREGWNMEHLGIRREHKVNDVRAPGSHENVSEKSGLGVFGP